jgi:hypothetical protein
MYTTPTHIHTMTELLYGVDPPAGLLGTILNYGADSSSGSSSSGSRKCQKINRSSHPGTAYLPTFLQLLRGRGAGAPKSLVALALDPLRNMLYAQNSSGGA